LYQNIYYQRERNLVHIWDDKLGYRTFPYVRYAYEKAQRGQYTSLYGDKLDKIFKFTKDDPNLFESDVAETTRVLVDTYTDSDIPSEGHVTLTYDIECEMDSGLPDVEKSENELTAIGLHDSATNHYWVLIMDKAGNMSEKKTGNRTVIPFKDERDMCMKYLELYEYINPTIVTGWNIDNFDTPYLYNRIKRLLGVKHANRLSPIGECFWSPYRKRFYMAGVSYLDYLALYKNFTYSELDNYRLDSIAMKELGRGKVEYSGNLDDLFKEDIDKFIEYNLVDVQLVVDMDAKLQFIDTARGICHAGHVPYEDFVYSSKYLEGALLCYLKRRNIVAPNKPADRQERMQALRDNDQEKFIGAYVKAPIVGKYEWIYDLDLTSLYPSIIMTTNISPETKVGKIDNWDAQKFMKGEIDTFFLGDKSITKDNLKKLLDESKYAISSNGVLYTTDKVGCIPDILDLWFKQRVEFRALEKKYGESGDKEKYAFYKKRQLVQKILLNSLYGVLGLPAFRFYDVDNAEAVTTTGQTVIKSTADMANIKYNKELGTSGQDFNIYIDTDSVFFSAVPILDHRYKDWRNLPDAEIALKVDAIAGETQDFLNKFYDVLAEKVFNVDKTKHRFQIKKEFVSRSGIWIAKKRYAQWIIAENGIPCDTLQVKGLDVVRSSYPAQFRKFMSGILISILQGETEMVLTDRIYDFKKDLVNMDVTSIAKNSAVKELSKYIPKKKDNRAMFQFNSGTPAHVKAAIAHNQLLVHFKCAAKHAPMRDGDKIKWVYLKQNPYGLDAVGFKGHDDPDEIMDLVRTYIDYDKIFERELLKKLEDFYGALGWGAVLSSQKTAEQFFSF
jgi:DNA polymerase elongation subunit (family B)